MYARNIWICRKIQYLELRKFNEKLCTLYMYRMSGFAENLNVQNCKNSTANCVHYIFTECLSLQKIWLSRTVKIQLEIVYTIYVRNVSICRKILYPELRKFNGKLCTLYIYGTSLLAENLIIQNYENSTGNCVHYICTNCHDLKRNWISRIE